MSSNHQLRVEEGIKQKQKLERDQERQMLEHDQEHEKQELERYQEHEKQELERYQEHEKQELEHHHKQEKEELERDLERDQKQKKEKLERDQKQKKEKLERDQKQKKEKLERDQKQKKETLERNQKQKKETLERDQEQKKQRLEHDQREHEKQDLERDQEHKKKQKQDVEAKHGVAKEVGGCSRNIKLVGKAGAGKRESPGQAVPVGMTSHSEEDQQLLLPVGEHSDERNLRECEQQRANSKRHERAHEHDKQQRQDEMKHCVVGTRNIILVGKTGAGKSTVANHISRTDLFGINRPVSSSTRSVRRGQEPVKCKVNDIDCKIKVVDTVGLHDTQLKNPEIIAELKQAFPDGINLILFIYQHSRFTEEDREPFNFIVKSLRGEASEISGLVVTGCEEANESTRDEIVRDLRSSTTTKHIAAFMKKGIFCVGFPDLKKIRNESVREVYKESITEDEDTLHNLVCGCEKRLTI